MPIAVRRAGDHQVKSKGRTWTKRPRSIAASLVVVALGVIAVLGYLVISPHRSGTRGSDHASLVVRLAPRPVPPPLPEVKFLPVSPQEAVAINDRIPVSHSIIEAARPFYLPTVGIAAAGNSRALQCLTSAIYYEAGGEPIEGQLAVAQVILNRVRHPAFPKSVCAVVFQGSERKTGCQFSFTCDGSLARHPSRSGWARALGSAQLALNGGVEPLVGMSTHYHTKWVVPYWASSLDKVGFVGAHIFYRWRGTWGRKAAFTVAYAGEPMAEQSKLAPLSTGDETALPPLASYANQHSPLIADEAPRLPLPISKLEEKSLTPAIRADAEAGTLLLDQQAQNR